VSGHGVTIAFAYDLVVVTVAVQPSSEICQIESSEPGARWGKRWAEHAPTEEEGN
jgi:hypothetical protein